MYPSRDYAEEGGLVSYGVSRRQIYWRAAEYIDRILKGAKPGDLPIEQPMKFELASTSGPPRQSASRLQCWCGRIR
jgi:putative tryptophan/tyrosine transport system substrate-binding protein